MQIKSNIGTLKDAHELKEDRLNPQDFQNVMQLLDSQVCEVAGTAVAGTWFLSPSLS